MAQGRGQLPLIAFLAAAVFAGALLLARSQAQIVQPGLSSGIQTPPRSLAREFVTVHNGTRFVVGCEPFVWVGANVWALVDLATGQFSPPRMAGVPDKPGRQMVDDILKSASDAGLTTIRLFATTVTGRNYSSWEAGPALRAFQYRESTLEALDFVVAAAWARRIRLVLVLVDFWQSIGGVRDVVDRCGAAVQDPSLPVNLDPATGTFYTNSTCRSIYADWLRAIVTRVGPHGVPYGRDPAIVAWELINEPRCKSAWGCSEENGLPAWADAMARHLRQLGARQLITTGEEGFFSEASGLAGLNPDSAHFGQWAQWMGQSFPDDHASPAIDFATLHVWPDNWGLTPDGTAGGTLPDGLPPSEAIGLDGARFLVDFIQSHDRVSRERLRSKPVILEEFGKEMSVGQGTTGDFAERDRFFSAGFAAVEQSYSGGGAVQGSMIWHLCDSGVDYDTPHYCVFPGAMGHNSTWAFVAAHAARMHAIARGLPPVCPPS